MPGGRVRHGDDEIGGHQRSGCVVDEDHAGLIGIGAVESGEPGVDRLLATIPPSHHGDHGWRQPVGGGGIGQPFGRGHHDHPTDLRRSSKGGQRPGQQRATSDVDAELVRAGHPGRTAGGDHDGIGPEDPQWRAQSMRGWAKIIRPATVCRTRVTDTSTSRSMCRAPPSTTIMVPSSRKPTP